MQKLAAMQALLRWKQLHEDSYIIYRNLTFDILCSSQNVHLLAASHPPIPKSSEYARQML